MNNETQRKAQQNTLINQLCSIQGMQDMAFSSVQFSKIFPGKNAPYIIRGIGADSLFVSSVACCLTFSYKLKQPPYLRQTNDDTESGRSRSLNAKEAIQNETKLPPRKSL